MDFGLEKARESDAEAVFSIVNAAYSVELGNTGLAFKSVDRYRNLGEVRRDLHEIYVARENDEVIGCVRAPVKNGIAFVGPLAVHPDHQGKGLGKKMMLFAETQAPIVQVDVVSCRADLFPFYERQGFKTVEEYPAEKLPELQEYISNKDNVLTREGLKMVIMHKKSDRFVEKKE